jgi:hypothetical protein
MQRGSGRPSPTGFFGVGKEIGDDEAMAAAVTKR